MNGPGVESDFDGREVRLAVRRRRFVPSRLLLVGVVVCCVAVALGASPMWAQAAFLVEDLSTSDPIPLAPGLASTPFALGNGRVVFSSFGPLGSFLWGTAGDPMSTEPLVEENVPIVGASGGFLFFLRANSDLLAPEISRTDGTAAGTIPLRAAVSGERVLVGFDSFEESRYTLVDGRLVFGGCTTDAGCELWLSSPGGEFLEQIGDMAPGPGHAPPERVSVDGSRLWWTFVSDTRTELAFLDLEQGGEPVIVPLPEGVTPTLLQASGGRAFFVSGFPDEELWVTDGTSAGTRAVSSFAAPRVFPFQPWIARREGGVYFVVDDVLHGFELWESDGTPEGTGRITDFPFAGALDGVDRNQVLFTGERYVFPASDGIDRFGIWSAAGLDEPMVFVGLHFGPLFPTGSGRVVYAGPGGIRSTDGRTEGGELIYPCDPCSFNSFALVPSQGVVYFAEHSELWQTDGRSEGTARVLTLPPGASIDPHAVRSGDTTYAVGFEPFYGWELWRGRPDEPARPVADTQPADASSDPGELLPVGERVLFSACTDSERSLFLGDARTPDAVPLTAVGPIGPCSLFPEPMLAVTAGELAFFTDRPRFSVDPVRPRLWRTDGTPEGTVLLLELQPPRFLGDRILTVDGGVVFVVSSDTVPELWRSDGTAEGTRLSAALSQAIGVVEAVSLGHTVILVVSTHEGGLELWRYGVASEVVTKIRDLDDVFLQFEEPPVRVGEHAVFAVRSDSEPAALLHTDGTVAGTQVVSVVADTGRSFEGVPSALVAHEGDLYFAIRSTELSPHGGPLMELWKAEPPALAPTRWHSLPLPPDASTAFAGLELTSDGDSLWFVGFDAAHGRELWVSDGTAETTRMVADVAPGVAGSSPAGLLPAHGALYFSASDGVHGHELFRSDGTAEGTRRVHDIAPGLLSSSPMDLVLAGDHIYFSADDALSGREVWALPLGDPGGCGPAERSLCLGDGRFRAEVMWRDFEGRSGRGRPHELTSDTGYFWFFDPDNVEIGLKVLDARAINDRFWVYSGALSNVEYHVTVTDVTNGSTVRYMNLVGNFGSFGDVDALPAEMRAGESAVAVRVVPRSPRLSRSSERAAPSVACAPTAERLCLGGDRFAVEISWSDGRGGSGVGSAVPLTADTGYFWFFDPANVEVLIKVLDARVVNDRFWVFFGALSDVEYTIRVTDTVTGAVREYHNPSGRFASVGDTEAF